MAEAARSADEAIRVALRHPLRLDALRILNGREASVAELARELRQNPKKVGNHVKVLLEHRFIQWTRTEKNRGADEHFYRSRLGASPVSAAEMEQMPPQRRSQVASHLFLGVVAEALASFRAGRVDIRPMRCASELSEILDDQAQGVMLVLVDEPTRPEMQLVLLADS